MSLQPDVNLWYSKPKPNSQILKYKYYHHFQKFEIWKFEFVAGTKIDLKII